MNKEVKLAIGAKLKQHREERHVSLDRVHEATKVPLDALRAIEEGYKIGTMSDFYYRSFVRMYAQYLELDEEEFLSQLPDGSSTIKQNNESAKPVNNKINKILTQLFSPRLIEKYVAVVVIAIVLLIGFQLLSFMGKALFAKKEAKPAVKAQTKDVKKDKKDKKETKKKEKKKKEKKKKQKKAPAPKPVAKPTPIKNPHAIALPVSLTVRATKNAWLKVFVDGNVAFQGILKKGVAEFWQGNDKIEVTGRGISHLEFEVNGEVIGKLGRSSLKAKKVIITKKGMDVKK